MKNSKHIKFIALALTVATAVSIGAIVFSQGSYPPPTGLTAQTQSVGSGQIKLNWQKPSSNEVIGYNIYRDGVYLDDVIGGGTLSYYNTNLSPSTSFDYFVKAVYLGVAEVDLPASNTVSAVSPAYCSGGAGTCVGLNPFVAGSGRTIIDLKGKKLDSGHKKSEAFTINLPAGRYQVYARSFDAYRDREDDTQSNERWFLSLLSSDKEVVKTNSTADLLDGKNEVGSTQVIETELVLTKPINKIQAVHAGVVNGGSFDDVGVSAVMFVNMEVSTGCLLVIDKTADKTVVAPGDLLTYTITVSNDGDANCTGGGNYIFDELPVQVEYVSETHTDNMQINDSANGPYYPDTHTVLLNATSPLVPGEVAIATITVRVKTDVPVASCEGDDIVNQVYVTNNEYGDRSVDVYSNSVSSVCDSNPEPDPIIDTTIVPSPNPSYPGPGGDVTWTATPLGSCPGPFSYFWTGNDGLSGSSASINHVYNNVGSYYATVTVSALGCEPVTKISPTPVVINPRNLSDITCEPSPKVAAVNQNVVWTAIPNPDGDYTYSWSGDNGLNGNTKSVTKSYGSPGTYRATVEVVGIGNSRCSSEVNVKINPNFQEF
ncbi:MAG: hypothetical protein CEO19_260 [Parcubacteria group bacterium Gr01-1014_73]|nr:MAG: hypothetical protein CEO19_260 [Parcubacteria group bacterium Gr01-1014_73]